MLHNNELVDEERKTAVRPIELDTYIFMFIKYIYQK